MRDQTLPFIDEPSRIYWGRTRDRYGCLSKPEIISVFYWHTLYMPAHSYVLIQGYQGSKEIGRFWVWPAKVFNSLLPIAGTVSTSQQSPVEHQLHQEPAQLSIYVIDICIISGWKQKSGMGLDPANTSLHCCSQGLVERCKNVLVHQLFLQKKIPSDNQLKKKHCKTISPAHTQSRGHSTISAALWKVAQKHICT